MEVLIRYLKGRTELASALFLRSRGVPLFVQLSDEIVGLACDTHLFIGGDHADLDRAIVDRDDTVHADLIQ